MWKLINIHYLNLKAWEQTMNNTLCNELYYGNASTVISMLFQLQNALSWIKEALPVSHLIHTCREDLGEKFNTFGCNLPFGNKPLCCQVFFYPAAGWPNTVQTRVATTYRPPAASLIRQKCLSCIRTGMMRHVTSTMWPTMTDFILHHKLSLDHQG